MLIVILIPNDISSSSGSRKSYLASLQVAGKINVWKEIYFLNMLEFSNCTKNG